MGFIITNIHIVEQYFFILPVVFLTRLQYQGKL